MAAPCVQRTVSQLLRSQFCCRWRELRHISALRWVVLKQITSQSVSQSESGLLDWYTLPNVFSYHSAQVALTKTLWHLVAVVKHVKFPPTGLPEAITVSVTCLQWRVTAARNSFNPLTCFVILQRALQFLIGNNIVAHVLVSPKSESEAFIVIVGERRCRRFSTGSACLVGCKLRAK